jgi:hypothetical protein
MLESMIAMFPPWLMITPLIGVIHGSLFFLLLGRRASSLPVYLVLGIAAASLAQTLQLLPPGQPPFSLGEVHLVATSLATWGVMLAIRAIGL